MPRGGARPGAGRKPNSEKYARQQNQADKLIKKNWNDIVGGLIELAKGVTVKEVDEDTGGVEIYVKPPDFKAASYLVDRILGKPTQKQEVTGEDGGPLTIKVEYQDPE